MQENPPENSEWLQKFPLYLKLLYATGPRAAILEEAFRLLSGNVCKSGPLHFGSEKSFPSNFAQETILGHK